jgi:hypothetical protein
MTKPNKQAEEIAALKAEVAALKAKVDPPKSEFKPQPYQQYDPTANMCMPMSTMMEMARVVPTGMLRDIVHDNRAPTGRPGMIPEQPSNVRGDNVAGSGSGWAHETPLGPPPGIQWVDRQLDAQDARDKAERLQQAAQTETARRFAEASAKVDQAIERTRKLMGQKP